MSVMGKSENPKKQERRRRSPKNEERDRRAQSRIDSILSDIEDATYTVLRRHEKNPKPSSGQKF
jgi:hypothetical protein